MKTRTHRMTILVVAIVLLVGSLAVAADRSKLPDKDKWDLTDLYATEEGWEKAKAEQAARIPLLGEFEGKLGTNAQCLLDALNLYYDIQKELWRLGSYASKLSDLDVRNAQAMERREGLAPLNAEFRARAAWFNPEVLSLPEETIASYFDKEPGLKIYKPVIDEILRTKAHTLTQGEEKVLADASLITGAPGSVYSIFSDADIPRPTVTLSNGETVRLDAASYTFYRGIPNRWDREHVFRAFFGNLNQFRGTFGTLLNCEVKKNLFRAHARKYEDCLSSALDGPNIPTAVYRNLISNVHKNLPTLWRYLKLRKRIMGLDQLRYSDLYASIIKSVDVNYTVDEAKHLVLKGVEPLGPDYVNVLAEGVESRWVDWHPTPGKTSGAYSSGSAYDVHPYILMNFTGTYEEVSTFAHEAGHTMHSYLSNQRQPFPTSRYTIFVAEVASTCNEHLLMDYMLKNTDDDDMKLFLLGSYVDNIRQTLFRQTQFAEFELKVHNMVESGQALTGDNLNAAYKAIIDKYYGVEEGVTVINPECYVEWAYIPHFYYNFYVFTYATSITASTAISQRILNNEPGAVESYLDFLSLGNSMAPVDELKIAGVDMTTDEPFDIAMKAMNRCLDEMEAILNRKEKK